MKAVDIYGAWKARHAAEWSEIGAGVSAADYAYVVVSQRLGQRKSLSYGYLVGHVDKANRRLVREQVDAVIRDAS